MDYFTRCGSKSKVCVGGRKDIVYGLIRDSSTVMDLFLHIYIYIYIDGLAVYNTFIVNLYFPALLPSFHVYTTRPLKLNTRPLSGDVSLPYLLLALFSSYFI